VVTRAQLAIYFDREQRPLSWSVTRYDTEFKLDTIDCGECGPFDGLAEVLEVALPFLQAAELRAPTHKPS